MKRHFKAISFLFIIGILLLGGVYAYADSCGAENYPAGSGPIGGGVGYQSILLPSSANYVVHTKAELLSALSAATSGQIVYIDDGAQIDLTGMDNINIHGGVTLSSGRGRNGSEGGLLFTNEHDRFIFPLVYAKGEGIRLTGLRLFGPDFEIGDHHCDEAGDAFKLGRGIQTKYPRLIVDNCELAGWGHAAIFLDKGATNASIHHNFIHHNQRSGLGYGVCHGYSSTSTAANYINSTIEYNIFDYNRHHIAGTGTPGVSYEARYNLSLEHDNGHSFDMHGGADRGDGTDIAGDWIKIHHNTFRDRDVSAVGIRGIPRNEAQIHNNWFYHDTAAQAIFQSNATGNLSVNDNFFGTSAPAGTILPVSLPEADVVSGHAPLTVAFNGVDSYDPGGSISSYTWFFGDGTDTIGKTAKGSHANYTFNDPGRYNVILEVKDDHGIPSKSIIPVTVMPSSGTCILSFWVKDSYRGPKSGYYQKEALIDGVVVWSDDIAGDEGWKHVVIDVSAQAAVKEHVTLGLRAHCLSDVTDPANEIIEIFTYWSDVSLFGFDSSNGDFVSTANWSYSENGSIWSGRHYTGDSRSGNYCYRICCGYMSPNVTGSWAKIEQVLTNATFAVAGVNDGPGTDIDVTASGAMIAANWQPAADAGSNIARYWYSIGTTVGGTNTAAWTSVALSTYVARTNLSLTNGTVYYVNVRAENTTGLLSAVRTSDGQLIQLSSGVSNLIGNWKFDEASGTVTTDSSTHGNNGSLRGGSQWTTGKVGSAIKFYGVNDYVKISSNSVYNITGDFSIDMWINPLSWSTGEDLLSNGLFRVYHRGEWAGNHIYLLMRINSSDDQGDSSWSGWTGVTTTNEVSTGTWHHLTCVRLGDNMLIYLDGVKEREVAALSGYSLNYSALSDLLIGRFNGNIDEVRIWNRALYETEVAGLYTYPGAAVCKADIIIAQSNKLTTGNHQVNVTFSEPVTGTPVLRSVFSDGSSALLTLAGAGRDWHGELAIASLTPEGNGYFVLMATTSYGGTVSNIATGSQFTVNTAVDPSSGGSVSNQDGAKVDVPAGAAFGTLSISINAVDRNGEFIRNADSRLTGAVHAIDSQNLCREFTATCNGTVLSRFNSQLRVTLPYADENQDGKVDGTDYNERNLLIAYLDEQTGRWAPLASQVDTTANTVSVLTDHFTVFAILATQPYQSINEVICYPNPCRPSQDGPMRIGHIPLDARNVTVNIFTIAGELVRTLREGTGIETGIIEKIGSWDGRNESGNKVASGVYLCLIKGSGGKKIEKAAILW